MAVKVIVGGVIEKDGKYLLVQEAKKYRGKWNLPAGGLDPDETILDGARREIKEESGVDVELTGVCQIGNRKDVFISVILTAKQIGGEITFNEAEIMDVRWFSYDEILKMRDENKIRDTDFLIGAIDNARAGIIAPLELVQAINEV